MCFSKSSCFFLYVSSRSFPPANSWREGTGGKSLPCFPSCWGLHVFLENTLVLFLLVPWSLVLVVDRCVSNSLSVVHWRWSLLSDMPMWDQNQESLSRDMKKHLWTHLMAAISEFSGWIITCFTQKSRNKKNCGTRNRKDISYPWL